MLLERLFVCYAGLINATNFTLFEPTELSDFTQKFAADITILPCSVIHACLSMFLVI